MKDTIFLSYTVESFLEKTDIDQRLVDLVKRVMKKIQKYFNANSYTSQRNCKE